MEPPFIPASSVNPSNKVRNSFLIHFDFTSLFLVRDIFQCARMTCPSVIFFDEIDSIVGKRSSEFGVGASSGDSVQERVLSALLNEMDGIAGGSRRNVLVIGATNRRDLIDDALLRPGRFDRHIYVNNYIICFLLIIFVDPTAYRKGPQRDSRIVFKS